MVGDYLARGMHGGIIYIRSEVDPYLMGKEVGQVEVTEKDRALLENLLGDCCKDFSEYGFGSSGDSEPYLRQVDSCFQQALRQGLRLLKP